MQTSKPLADFSFSLAQLSWKLLVLVPKFTHAERSWGVDLGLPPTLEIAGPVPALASCLVEAPNFCGSVCRPYSQPYGAIPIMRLPFRASGRGIRTILGLALPLKSQKFDYFLTQARSRPQPRPTQNFPNRKRVEVRTYYRGSGSFARPNRPDLPQEARKLETFP